MDMSENPARNSCWCLDSKLLALVARLAVGGVFVYLAGMKLADPPLFLKSLEAYGMLPTEPPQLLNGIAIFMPWAEMLVGLCLLAGVLPRGAAFTALAMLVAFTAAVFLRGLSLMSETNTSFMAIEFDCGCGTGEVLLWSKLLSNAALILGALLLSTTRARLWTIWTLERAGGSPVACSS
jgi:uncharacterized membrane protein YphA (DoxX/SURF4 family)